MYRIKQDTAATKLSEPLRFGLDVDLKTILTTLPDGGRVELFAEDSHLVNDIPQIRHNSESGLHVSNHCRIQLHLLYLAVVRFYYKYEGLIVSFNFINRIVVYKISGRIYNWPTAVDFNSLEDVAGVAKNDICTSVDQAFGKRDMIRLRAISPVWSPMG